jgi:hypothetical protein
MLRSFNRRSKENSFNTTLTPTIFVGLPNYPIVDFILSIMGVASTAAGCNIAVVFRNLKLDKLHAQAIWI